MADNQAVETPKAPKAIGPYSQAVRAGSLIFVSGQIPADPASGVLQGSTVAEQTEQVLRNVAAVLAAGGSGMAQVVKTTVYLTDMARFAEMNEVYARHFSGTGGPFPARATVAVSALPKGAQVEIDAVGLVS